jgi:flavodoxin
MVRSQSSGSSRRETLKGGLLLPLIAGAGVSASGSSAQQLPSDGKVLVACFSRTGNTRVVAGQIRRALGAGLFDIQPAEPYPEDYEATVGQAQRERDSGYEPPLKETVPDIDSYGVVFLGFPIWGMTAPPVIRSFLSRHDLSRKTLVPFITHGGYGLGQSLAVLADHAPRARLLDGFAMEADQERETLTRVTRWLDSAPSGE